MKFKKTDFKLFEDLPDEYEYSFITLKGELTIIGTLNNEIIGFYVKDDGLVQINFKEGK